MSIFKSEIFTDKDHLVFNAHEKIGIFQILKKQKLKSLCEADSFMILLNYYQNTCKEPL